MRRAMIPVGMSALLMLLVLSSGCRRSADAAARDAIRSFGQPDLIRDQAGDLGRYGRPGTPGPEWPNAVRTLYYLNRGFKITIPPDGPPSRQPITESERQLLQETLDSLPKRK